MGKNDINININGKYNAKSAYKEAEKDMDSLGKKAKSTDASLKKTNRGIGTFGAGASKGSNNLKSLGAALGTFNTGLGSSVGKIGGAQGALAGLTAAFGGPLVAAVAAAGAAIAAFAVMSYQKAIASQAEWAKFKGVVESAGQSFENSKTVVKDFAFSAGRSVGEVRTAFSKLTAAGVNPTNEALRSVNQLAIGLGTNMESAAVAYNRIMQGKGGRTLTQLGIKNEEIMTGGKIDGAKLQAILEQKFGKAGDNFSKTGEAAGVRLQTAVDGIMVAFGNLLIGPATLLQNGLAYIIKGLTELGGFIFNLFGGFNAFDGAMKYLTPAIDELGKAFSDLMSTIWPNTKATGQLKPVLTALGASLATMIRTVAMVIKAIAWITGAAKNTANALINAGRAIWNGFVNAGNLIRSLPGRAWNMITGGLNSFASSVRSAGSSLWSAIRGAPGWIYNAIVNAIPRIHWPSWGDIAGWIKNMIWGSRGPGMGLGSVSSQIARQSALRTANLAAQRAALVSSYQASPAAQQAASQATSSMGIFGGLSGFFGPGDWKSRIAGMTYTYQDYGGSRQKAWDGSSNCMTGNCVDMSLGVLNAAAQAGARGGSLRFGTWNGGPHVWAEVEGITVDPARKALNNTFAAPARGPGGSNGNTYVFQGPVYDWNAFKKQVQRANDNIVGGIY